MTPDGSLHLRGAAAAEPRAQWLPGYDARRQGATTGAAPGRVGCSLSAGVRNQAHRKQRGVLLESEPKRERDSGTIGHERLIQHEAPRRECFVRHGANQPQGLPLAPMGWMCDDAGIDGPI